ncbi:MAG: hypothetical protein JO104_10235 [Candidatus Eremiobacteraeota bacterium]|nr:hypothetical protein [Candidatus Eremiobacteraeota bacterium]
MQRREHCFIVRLWRESGAPDGDWRGSVDHVGSQERRYFAALDALEALIAERIGGMNEEGDHPHN